MTIILHPNPVEALLPSAALPSIDLDSQKQLHAALEYIRAICVPHVPGTSCIVIRGKKTWLGSTGNDASIDLDTFERLYLVRWLTKLLRSEFEELAEEASKLLAIMSGSSGAGILTRQYAMGVTIRDVALDNTDFSSMGCQTWGGSCVLAQMMIDHGDEFFPGGSKKLHVLELGAGTGLVSLTAAKVLSSMRSPAEITATDYHDTVLENLQYNVSLNAAGSAVNIQYLDWSTFSPPSADVSPEMDLEGRYDVILGTDICYSPPHVPWVYNTIHRLLGLNAIFHLLVPLRRGLEGDSARSVEDVFNMRGAGRALEVKHKESVIGGGAGENGSDEVEYAYYRIGWV